MNFEGMIEFLPRLNWWPLQILFFFSWSTPLSKIQDDLMTPCASAPEVEIRRHCLFQIPAHERDDGQVMKTKVPATWTTQWIIFLGCFPHAIWLALQRQEMLFARTRTFGRWWFGDYRGSWRTEDLWEPVRAILGSSGGRKSQIGRN